MKTAQTRIAIAINALIAFGLYSLHRGEHVVLLGVVSFMALSAPAALAMGLELQNRRASTNVRLISGLTYVLALGVNVVFSFIRFNYLPYIFVNGFIILLFASVALGIAKAKQ